ncbi:MAG TPA: FCD domain-containing protein [Conexibacter sp.]|jgi:DNA-binding FadR family transcriptional regulator
MSTSDVLTPRVSRAETLARQLEREIRAQAIPPGVRLGTKVELRERFGVAAGTLNEAVRVMETRGIVIARPGPGGGVFVADSSHARHGTVVLELDFASSSISDCAELRASLEPAICRSVARDHTPADIAEIQRLVGELADSGPDPHAFREANWSFHRGIAAICPNVPLRTVYLAAIGMLEEAMAQFGFTSYDARAVAVHRELADAIAEGEGARLERAIRRHERRSPLPSPAER